MEKKNITYNEENDNKHRRLHVKEKCKKESRGEISLKY